MPIDNVYSSGASGASRLVQKPSARERGRMRRRLRGQRRVREALLLDLGALVFELHRQGRREPELLQAKAAELSAVDQEVRALAHALDAGQALHELVATGIAGSCESCGSLLSTDARYCSACGVPAVPALGDDGGRLQTRALDSSAREETPGSLGRATPAAPEGGPIGRIRGRLGRRNADG